MSVDSALRLLEVTNSNRNPSPMATPSGIRADVAGTSLSTSATVVASGVPADTPEGSVPKLRVMVSSLSLPSWKSSSVATTTKLSVGRPSSSRTLAESKVTEVGTPE